MKTNYFVFCSLVLPVELNRIPTLFHKNSEILAVQTDKILIKLNLVQVWTA